MEIHPFAVDSAQTPMRGQSTRTDPYQQYGRGVDRIDEGVGRSWSPLAMTRTATGKTRGSLGSSARAVAPGTVGLSSSSGPETASG